VYRVPYENGTTVRVSNDEGSHFPPNRYDLVGTGGNGLYRVVAAAAGTVRHIVDGFDQNRPDGNPCNNNFVWIEHPHGVAPKVDSVAVGLLSGRWSELGDDNPLFHDARPRLLTWGVGSPGSSGTNPTLSAIHTSSVSASRLSTGTQAQGETLQAESIGAVETAATIEPLPRPPGTYTLTFDVLRAYGDV
jgi:hypothetical protein